MNRLFRILVPVVAVGWLACSAAERGTPAEATSQATPGAEQTSQEEIVSQEAVERQQTQARVEQLARLETEQRLRGEYEARHRQDLLQLQADRADAWTTMLRTNWPAYQALVQEAARSPHHNAHCTFCGVRGQIGFCIVCGASGKCVRCKGSGQIFGEPCTTCRGKGKCFLCFGTGHMPCPFCKAGFVYYPNEAPPPAAMPVPPDSTDEPSPQPNQITVQAALEAPGNTSRSAQESQSPAQPPPEAAPSEIPTSSLALAAVLILGIALAFRKLVPSLARAPNARFNPKRSLALRSNRSLPVLEEEDAVAAFMGEVRIGPKPAPLRNPAIEDLANFEPIMNSGETSELRIDPLEGFFASAPKAVQELRKLLQESGRVTEHASRMEMLDRLGEQLHRFKGMAGLPEVLPAWQMACALEWLANQLSEKISRVNPSTLRTLANGLDLLGELCRPGLRPDLCTAPPIRLLAVDDDAITRRALSFALKRGLNQPDLAEDGAAALALAAKQPYDVIFLDVHMPGMDGFELCSKIHQTLINSRTPVVFVTLHSDFDSRAKSALCGGNDLIGKPFLTFEITVKALTLALRARIQAGETEVAASEAATPGQAEESMFAIPMRPPQSPAPLRGCTVSAP